MDSLVIPTLETERLRLRPLCASDFEDYERLGGRLVDRIEHLGREMLRYGFDRAGLAGLGLRESLLAAS